MEIFERITKAFSDESLEDLQNILDNPRERPYLEKVLSDAQKSYLFYLTKDKFIATIIKQVSPDFWKIDSKNGGRKENLLHFFINERFLLSIEALLGLKHPHVAQIISEVNLAGSTPFMSSLKQKMEEVSLKIWEIKTELTSWRFRKCGSF